MTQPLTESLSPFVMTEWPEQGRDEMVEDYTDLLEELTGRDQEPTEVEENLDRVLRSPISHLVVVQQGSQFISTATLNSLPVLSGTGRRLWIDDVVTLPTYQKQGHSKRVMNLMEELAANEGDAVYLSSSAHRGPARQGYEKRGYELLNEASEPQVIFRNTKIGKGEDQGEMDAEVLGTNFTAYDVEELAALLGEDPLSLEKKLQTAVDSPTTRVFVTRGEGGGISGVAVANETPIPVGKKPWIDDIAGLYEHDLESVVHAAGTWLGSSYKHVNIVSSPTSDFGEDWKIRDSGLYVKRLGSLALPGSAI
jgi:GNAT superfamily N-acetyltransferase